MSRWFKITLSVLLGLILLSIWLYFIDLSEMLSYLKNLDFHYVITAGTLYLVAYLFRSLRWRQLLSPIIKVGILQSYGIWMSGNFINYLIPIRAGELAKPYYIKKLKGVPISNSLPSVFIDKLFDLLAIVIVIILIPFLQIELSQYLHFLIFALAGLLLVGIIILLGAIHFRNNLTYFFEKILFFVPNRFEEKFLEVMHLFFDGIAIFKGHSKILLISVLLTFAAVITDSLFFYSLFRAFGADIFFFKILFGYTLIYLSYVLPQPPAQIGSNQLMMVLIFSVGFGLDKELASAIMTFSHLLTAILIMSVGIFSTSLMGLKLFNFSEKK